MENTVNVEAEAQKQAEMENELAELETVDMSLPNAQLDVLMARERYNYVASYQNLTVRSAALKATINMNAKTGGKVNEQYQTNLETVQNEMNFMLRAVRNIDNKYPNAKAKMLAGLEKESK